jgi:hypothetical protein
MSDYTEFFLNSKSSVVQLELLEISHPDFTKVYYVVRNATNGVTVTLEDLSSVEFVYYPLQITSIGTRENLDFGVRVDLGDLGEVLPVELDLVASNSGYETKPVVKYRTYRSDDLTAPLFGPVTLEVSSFSFTRNGSSFEAKAPLLNINKTGEIYSFDRFPMLRGFL